MADRGAVFGYGVANYRLATIEVPVRLLPVVPGAGLVVVTIRSALPCVWVGISAIAVVVPHG